MYNKEQIDSDAEREGLALSRQGKRQPQNYSRIRQEKDYGEHHTQKELRWGK